MGKHVVFLCYMSARIEGAGGGGGGGVNLIHSGGLFFHFVK